MCGIFGITTKANVKLSRSVLEQTVGDLFRLSESRGKEAAGVAVIRGGTIHICKTSLSASDFVKSDAYKNLWKNVWADDASPENLSLSQSIAVIGHTRLVTNGAMELNANNQPVVKDDIIGVHNGIIVNDAELWESYPVIHKKYDVDTEVILSLIKLFLNKREFLIDATKHAFGIIEGTASIALLFKDRKQLLLASNNGSLYVSNDEENSVSIFASERHILERLIGKNGIGKILSINKISQIKSGSGCLIGLNDGGCYTFSFEEKPQGNGADGIKLSFENFYIKDMSPQNQGESEGVGGRSLKAQSIPENEYFCAREAIATLRRCTNCILPRTMPFIEFNESGVCNYCRNYKKIEVKGKSSLEDFVAPYRRGGGKPDCLVPLSGGRDSSFGLHYIKNILGMNPIAFSYDWGMITDLGRRNQARMCGSLGVEHIIVSADIRKKRRYIKKNINAWLRMPALGTIPLFMAGDKQYFHYINKLKKQIGTELVVYSENPLEKTDFKTGFCRVKPKFDIEHVYNLGLSRKGKLLGYYLGQYARNPAYLNTSVMDTAWAYFSSFFISHEYLYLYRYIPWDEKEVESTLIKEYDWETAKDTKSTWRIGDGTAAFYNYIYYTVAGFTENDTFRSNQIREGTIKRDEALRLSREDNRPRFESIKWYCDTVGIDFENVIKVINSMPKLYGRQI